MKGSQSTRPGKTVDGSSIAESRNKAGTYVLLPHGAACQRQDYKGARGQYRVVAGPGAPPSFSRVQHL